MLSFNTLSLTQIVGQVSDSISTLVDQGVVSSDTDSSSVLWDKLVDFVILGGEKILIAIIVFVVGKFLINIIKRFTRRILQRRKVDPGVKSFLMSMLNILLVTLLVVSVIGALGINTTSFAALIASAGVAIGMALSGNLQNFAGGVIILLFKPYRIGDYIECQGVSGTVQEIQIFHTVIRTPDYKQIFIPNGSLSSGVITNVNNQDRRRVQWMIAVEYGEDVAKVEAAIRQILESDERILKDPKTFIALHALGDNGVNFVARGWVQTSDYWGVYFDINKKVYEEFNKQGIGFPFPQLTIHKGQN